METLSVLEKKVISLIDTIKQLKADNTRLVEENIQLAEKLLVVQSTISEDAKKVNELDQEKNLTMMVVDDLIKSIDSLMESEK